MPSKYVRKTNMASWNEESLKKALEAIESGTKIREAAKLFGIHEATLRLRRKNKNTSGPKLGGPPTFPAEAEEAMAQRVLKLAKLFHGLTQAELRKIAFQYAEANGIRHEFNKIRQEAGKDWLHLFLNRHPEISLRRPEGTSINRIIAFNEESVNTFFTNLESVLEKYKFAPSRIFNVDETGISTVQKPTKQLGPKGVKQFGSKISWERGKNVTAICAMSASGIYIPPLIIFPRKRMSPALTKNGPAEGIYAITDNGWSDETCFLKWLKHFQTHTSVSQANPVLLILDNHYSHISLSIYNYCRENGIVMLSLAPHTSNRLQPLDVSFFGPLKCAFNKECDSFLRSGKQEKITFFDLAKIFNNAYVKVATMGKAMSGFESTGIWPLNRDKFTAEDFEAAKQYMPIVLEENVEDLDSIPSTSNATNKHQSFDAHLPISTSEIISIAEENIFQKDFNPVASTSNDVPSHQHANIQLPILTANRVSLSELLPLPSYSATKRKTKRGKSEIMTATPMKLVLEEKEEKKSKEKQDTKS